jgi:hypothetical protein
MRSLYPALLASLLALSPLACKRDGGDTRRPNDSTTARPSGPKLPKPLKLPADPQAVVHVQSPKGLLDTALSYGPTQISARDAVQQALQSTGRAFETRVFPHVGIGRAWNMALVDGQTIVHVPVRKAAAGQLQAMLAEYPAEGDFGAVRIPRPQGEIGPKLAFFDRENLMLTLADDLRGIATGPELGRAYGGQGINISVNAEQAARYGAELAVARVSVTGTDANNLTLELEGAPPIPTDVPITEGALTSLVESPRVAVGGTTKYVDYKKDVDRIIQQGRRQVSSLPGIAQGNGKDLLKRLSSVLRNWNGRTMVGVGPANHVLLGFGTDDSDKMSQATLFLVRGLLSNIKTVKSLRKFGVKLDVPTLRFAPNKARVGSVAVHVVALENARKYVPSEFHKLVNGDNRLRIAMAFPKRAGAGMVAIGPNADVVLTRWLEDAQAGTPAAKSTGHLAAGTLAVGPKALQQLAQAEFNPAAVLGLTADRKPTKVVVKRNAGTYVVQLRRK